MVGGWSRYSSRIRDLRRSGLEHREQLDPRHCDCEDRWGAEGDPASYDWKQSQRTCWHSQPALWEGWREEHRQQGCTRVEVRHRKGVPEMKTPQGQMVAGWDSMVAVAEAELLREAEEYFFADSTTRTAGAPTSRQ